MFDWNFPFVFGGAVSSAGYAVIETGGDKCAFENKIKSQCFDEAIEYLKLLQLQVQTLAVMNGLGLNPQRLPPVLPPTQTRINGTLEQDLNFGTLLGASHLLVTVNHPNQLRKCAFPQTLCFEDNIQT
ncbi:hypothetical protein DY000_02033498 [Brassica cretica]|uniref:Uncharacterized protein n=1 Tax=Brassica cretica TaxID=69181 RepID=A0ABQ7DE58_BRACR|nr:hypothetical protein DY000_02033498 [Brassica cretica]